MGSHLALGTPLNHFKRVGPSRNAWNSTHDFYRNTTQDLGKTQNAVRGTSLGYGLISLTILMTKKICENLLIVMAVTLATRIRFALTGLLFI